MISKDHNHHHHQDPLGTTKSYHMKTSAVSPPPSSTSTIALSQSAWLEVRLFYVRIAPCVVENVPDFLTLRHPRRETGASLEVNGFRVPSSQTASLKLRRDRVDRESSEVTYVSTETVRVTGCVDFEVYDNDDMVLCGNLDRIEGAWNNGTVSDPKTGWGMDCYIAMGNGHVSGPSSSAFFQPKFGVSSPSVEVYIAGCCGGVPVILTKTIQASPRRKVARHVTLDAIPEDEEVGKEQDIGTIGDELARQSKVQMMESEVDDYDDSEMKMAQRYYPEGMYVDEDGQLSWFNAGVRVGVGIGLGMCLGVGIGVGLLMRSYQATTSNLRRRFL
ncbi:unnamed protein product [Arabidopsis arenosa]|uniref:Uncharacterized protein n=1 Tax=Arabidopsis arenosa TaxID=38785 RepID=A0A8S1ZER7_ARAAE|nr:unnamed protein product [Arabidopsis arenosa]